VAEEGLCPRFGPRRTKTRRLVSRYTDHLRTHGQIQNSRPAETLRTVLLSPGAIGRPLLTPPNLPADRLDTLRNAYGKMIHDPDFLAEAKKRDWDVEYISGQDLETTAKAVVTQSPETIERLKKILGE
jgi:hypothetical protein